MACVSLNMKNESFFWEQAMPTSLEIEEDYSQEKWSAESGDQPLFESKQRLLALETEEITGRSTLSELLFFFFFWEQATPTSFGNWRDHRTINPFRATFFFWEQAMHTSLEIEEINVAINPFRATFFWEQATPTSLEIEEVSFRLRLRLVLRGNEGYLRHELIYKVINSCFRENLVQIYF